MKTSTTPSHYPQNVTGHQLPTADVMVVDDTPANLHLFIKLLTAQGYHIRPITEGTQAIAAAQSSPPDVILLDIQMPVMDGIALALKAHEMAAQMPILLMTGYAEQRERAGNLQHVVRDVVAKPFTLKIIREAVVSALR